MWGNRERTVIEVSEDMLKRVFADALACKFKEMQQNQDEWLSRLGDYIFARTRYREALYSSICKPTILTPHKPFGRVNGVEITSADFEVLVKCGIPINIEYDKPGAKKKDKK